MGWIQDTIARARAAYKKVDVALGGILPLGVTREEAKTPSVGQPVITPKEVEEGARGQVVDIAGKPREPSKDVLKPEEKEVKVPAGRARTDVEAEVKLREQGFMTVQTGTDELGMPLTQIISISGFKEQSAEAQKAEADLALNILMKGFAATPGVIMGTRAFRGIIGKAGKIGTDGHTVLRTTRTPSGKIISEVVVNTKTIAQTKSILSRFFSAKALTIYGAWAGAVTIGKWGQAEAAEGITFPMNKYLIPEAERTGDWTAVNEALALADEITDTNIWEKIALWTPLAPFVGIPKKIQGAAAGVAILEKYTDDQKRKQEIGQTETQYWEQRAIDQAEQDKFAVDYYNEQRKNMLEWEREAKKQARNEDAAFWREERVKQFKMEEEDRQAIADFWIAYKKEAAIIAENSRPSNLNFGLL